MPAFIYAVDSNTSVSVQAVNKRKENNLGYTVMFNTNVQQIDLWILWVKIQELINIY